jgi:hypothetical protein
MYRSFDLLRDLDSQRGTRIVAGHDPAVASRFRPGPGSTGPDHPAVTRIA